MKMLPAELAGMQRMKAPVPDGHSSTWHDALIRFDGHASFIITKA
jgi:hypothetical protein